MLNRRKLSLNRRRWLHCNKWWARSFFCKMPQSEIWAKIGFLYAKKYTVFLKKVHHRWLWRLWILSVMCICFQWHVITGGLNSVFSLLVCSTEFKLLNSIVNTRDLDFFAPNDVPSYLPKIFSDQGFFPWKSLSALEDFMPVYRSHHPKVMVMRDQLGVSLWGRLHCTLSTSLYCNCTTWSYADQSCIPRCKLNSKEIKYYTYNAFLPDQWSHLVS